MPADITSLQIKVDSVDVRRTTGDLDKFTAGGQKAEKATKNLGQSFSVAKVAMFAGAAAVGAVTAAAAKGVRQWMDYNKSMLEVQSIAGATADEMADLRQGVLDVSIAMGTDAVDGAKALYQLLSAGVPKENAIEFLATSSELAVAGVTDTATAVDGLTNVINAFGLETGDASSVADDLFTTVKLGKTTVEELSSNLSKASVSSNALGLSYQELLANFISITKQGTKSSEAFTQINALTTSLVKPTKELAAQYDKLGISSADAAIAAEGFNPFLNRLIDSFEGNQTATVQALSSTEAYKAALAVTGETASEVSASMKDLADNTGAAGEAAEINARTMGNLGEKAEAALVGWAESTTLVSRLHEGLLINLENTVFMFNDLRKINDEAAAAGAAAWDATAAAFKAAADDGLVFHDVLGHITQAELDLHNELSKQDDLLTQMGANRTGFLKIYADELKLSNEITETEEDKLQVKIQQIQAIIDSGKASDSELRTAYEALGVLNAQTEAVRNRATATREAISLVKSLETDSERAFRKFGETANAIDTNSAFSEGQREEQHRRNLGRYDQEIAQIAERNKKRDAPPKAKRASGGSRGSRQLGDTADGLANRFGLGDEDGLLTNKLENERQVILDATNITEEERTELLRQHAEKRNEILTTLEQARVSMIFSTASDGFGALADLTGEFAGKQSAAYKVLFGVSKGFALAEAAIGMQVAISQAMKLPFPANIPAIGQAVAMGTQVLSTVQSIGGNFAEGGVVGGNSFSGDNIQANVNSGEMILNGQQQKNLFDQANGGGSGGGVVVNVVNMPGQTAEVVEKQTDKGKEIEIIIMKTKKSIASDVRQGRGEVPDAMEQTWNLGRGGR